MWRVQIRQCSNLEHFQQIWNSWNVLRLSIVNSWKTPHSTTDVLCTARSRLLPESADKLLSKIQLPVTTKLQLINVQHNFCSVMCYIVLIWILIILTLGNNILSHPFNWHRPVCCISSDKINLYQATFTFEFDEFWKLKFTFDECEFWTASSHMTKWCWW